MTTVAQARARRPPPLPVVTVPRLLPDGGTVVCIASGPSLTEDDVEYCRGKALVIAVNDAVRYATWADALYASDHDWWALHRGCPLFAGLKYSASPASAQTPGVQILRRTGDEGIELDPTGLKTNRNSGAAALNLAVHFGATRVLLLGYDCGVGKDGKTHFFGNHRGLRNEPDKYVLFRKHFGTMVQPLKAAGVQVINCSVVSALDCFPKLPLREALTRQAVAA